MLGDTDLGLHLAHRVLQVLDAVEVVAEQKIVDSVKACLNFIEAFVDPAEAGAQFVGGGHFRYDILLNHTCEVVGGDVFCSHGDLMFNVNKCGGACKTD